MKTFNEINYKIEDVSADRTAIAFVIDQEVVETVSVYSYAFDFMINADELVDVSQNFNYGIDNIVIEFRKNGQILETLVCYELLGVVLLSTPTIIKLCSGSSVEEILASSQYRYFEKVVPGWKYINNDLVLPGYYE